MRPHLPLVELLLLGLLAIVVTTSAAGAFAPAPAPGAVSIRGITPGNGATLPARPLEIAAEIVAERALQRVSLLVDDKLVQPLIDRRSPTQWRVTYRLAEPKGDKPIEHSASILARDRFGRQASQSWRFQLDPELSAPRIISHRPPMNGFAPAGMVQIAAVVKTDSPVTKAELTLNEQQQAAAIEPASSGRTSVSTKTTLRPGTYRAVLTIIESDGDRGSTLWDFTVPEPQDMLAFEQTGRAISGGFRRFWEDHGGLAIFGLPISNEMREGELLVQYFERARFEYHDDRSTGKRDVKLGLLGTELQPPAPARPLQQGEDGRYFPQTGHAILPAFHEYWQQHGGLELFGLPTTDAITNGGVTTQYFERARFELHTVDGKPAVLLGHIGREVYERRYGKPSEATGS